MGRINDDTDRAAGHCGPAPGPQVPGRRPVASPAMLPALVAVVAGLLIGLAAGRRPPAGAAARVGAGVRVGAVAVAVAVAVAGVTVALVGRAVPGGAGVAVLVGGYALLAATALAARRHPGMVLVAAGLLANLVVVAVDGGMPVRTLPPGAVASGHHHGLGPADRLTGLADDTRLPVLGAVVSAGDVVACVGAAVAAFAWLEPVGGRRPVRRPPAGDRPAG